MFANHETGCRFPNTLDHVVHEHLALGERTTVHTVHMFCKHIKLSCQFKQKKKERTFIKK